MFVEVKARRASGLAFGTRRREAITPARSAPDHTAQSYLAENGAEGADWRIDVVTVSGPRRARGAHPGVQEAVGGRDAADIVILNPRVRAPGGYPGRIGLIWTRECMEPDSSLGGYIGPSLRMTWLCLYPAIAVIPIPACRERTWYGQTCAASQIYLRSLSGPEWHACRRM